MAKTLRPATVIGFEVRSYLGEVSAFLDLEYGGAGQSFICIGTKYIGDFVKDLFEFFGTDKTSEFVDRRVWVESTTSLNPSIVKLHHDSDIAPKETQVWGIDPEVYTVRDHEREFEHWKNMAESLQNRTHELNEQIKSLVRDRNVAQDECKILSKFRAEYQRMRDHIHDLVQAGVRSANERADQAEKEIEEYRSGAKFQELLEKVEQLEEKYEEALQRILEEGKEVGKLQVELRKTADDRNRCLRKWEEWKKRAASFKERAGRLENELDGMKIPRRYFLEGKELVLDSSISTKEGFDWKLRWKEELKQELPDFWEHGAKIHSLLFDNGVGMILDTGSVQVRKNLSRKNLNDICVRLDVTYYDELPGCFVRVRRRRESGEIVGISAKGVGSDWVNC